MPDLSHILDKIASGSGQLYTLPVVAVKVLDLTQDPRVDAREMKECIENDPALVIKVLKVVNSSLFGLSREVSDLNQALALLGIKPLKLLVLGFSLPDALFRDVAGDVLSHYWRHTLSRAAAARELSERFWNKQGDDAFLAGLLKDIGLLVLVQELGEPFVRFAARVRADQGDLVALERATLGFDHVQLTARLLTEWNMPPSLVENVTAHRAGDCSAGHGDEPLGQIMHLAELMAMAIADGRAAALPELIQAAEAYRMISSNQLQELIDQLSESVGQLADALSLNLSEQFDYQQITDAAHSQLVEVAAEVAGDMVRQTAEMSGNEAGGLPDFEEARSLVTAANDFQGQPHQTRDREKQATSAVLVKESQAPALIGADADPGLLARVSSDVAACRRDRCSLSLLIVELDRYSDLVFHAGAGEAERLLREVVAACGSIDHHGSTCVEVGEARYGLVLADCERQEAVRAGRQLLRVIHSLSNPDDTHRLSVSIGAASVAVPSPNFPPADLITAANRCLNGVRGSGGDGLKSIEIY